MDVAKLRAWYAHRQGLDGRLDGSTAAQVIEQTGWIRSLGSPTPYLALYRTRGDFARGCGCGGGAAADS